MHEMSQWGSLPDRSRVRAPSKDRLTYLEHLREVHDDRGFRLALTDLMKAPDEEIETLLFEAEMLANYGVA